MLRLTDEFKDAEIIRTRDPKLLDTLDCLVDVGGTYVPEKYRFDHHQREFNGTLDADHTIKLSSAGLVYKHFGHQIIAKLLGTTNTDTINLVYARIYTLFVEAIDAIDNGTNLYDTDLAPRYRANTDLSSRVGFLNSSWNDPNPNQDERFKDAVALAGKEFSDSVIRLRDSWLPARQIVETALDKKDSEFGANAQILKLECFAPWNEHLHEIEKERKIEGLIKYVLFADRNGTWRIQAVPVRPGSFENRLALPEAWRGLRDQQLDQATKIEGTIFVHAAGFIGGAKTLEGVTAMAKQSLTIAGK